jgi:D-beta-D-heptose 7-phosphate kinase / D-beta-D-heptose 1-phosphate adenosyltransferase
VARQECIESVLICDHAHPTTRKARFVSDHFSTHMLRAPIGNWPRPPRPGVERKLFDAILPHLARADIVLLSDYAKGVLTAGVIRNVIDGARKAGKRGSSRAPISQSIAARRC